MKLIQPVHPEDLAAVRAWFDTLSRHCRAVDYEGARPIFAEDMIAFGTFTDFMHGRDLAEQKQWRNVWGTIRNFRYDLDKVMELERRALNTVAPVDVLAARLDMTMSHDRTAELHKIHAPSLIVACGLAMRRFDA